MIISRESRKSRKIIHRYRSYVAVRMANASEMMRFRVICEIRVRQKSCVKREYFYNAYSLVIMCSSLSLRRETIFSQRRDNIISAERSSCLRGETRISANISGNTHYNPIRYCIHFSQAISLLPHADTADLRRAHTLTLVCAIRRVISSALPYS